MDGLDFAWIWGVMNVPLLGCRWCGGADADESGVR